MLDGTGVLGGEGGVVVFFAAEAFKRAGRRGDCGGEENCCRLEALERADLLFEEGDDLVGFEVLEGVVEARSFAWQLRFLVDICLRPGLLRLGAEALDGRRRLGVVDRLEGRPGVLALGLIRLTLAVGATTPDPQTPVRRHGAVLVLEVHAQLPVSRHRVHARTARAPLDAHTTVFRHLEGLEPRDARFVPRPARKRRRAQQRDHPLLASLPFTTTTTRRRHHQQGTKALGASLVRKQKCRSTESQLRGPLACCACASFGC